MSTANHLTIRDYFDRVFTGKQRTMKVFSNSPQRANASGTGMFHRLLASRQILGVENANVKSTGLTIVDYLANPLGLKGRYQRSPELLSPKAKAERSPGRQVLAATKASSGKGTASSLSATKPVPSLRPSVAMPSQKQSGSHERHKIEKSIQKAASKYNLSPGLIKGVIRAESNFQVDAVSRAGAQGLMQLMPDTAKELGVTKPLISTRISTEAPAICAKCSTVSAVMSNWPWQRIMRGPELSENMRAMCLTRKQPNTSIGFFDSRPRNLL
jgi:hypothetical protein